MKTITKIEPSTARPSKAKTRVAAYCRVSTGTDDQLVSLETQKTHYEDLISSNPDWEYAGLYFDAGVSGTGKEKRPALQRMIADCEAGKIDRILTKSLSRFARNTTDCLELTRKLLGMGITIFFEKENIDTGSMESELLLSIMSSLAESESVSISENNKWGMRRRFENGTFKFGYAPYGYSVKDGQMTINEDEAKWVRWIFAQALNGKSSSAIAKELNEQHVPSRKNGNWTATTIRGVLTNEKYIGACLFQKTFSDFRFHRHKNTGECGQFYAEDHHEAIISKEDFKAVGALLEQRALEKNTRKGDPRFRNRYPFTGMLLCGECGSTLKRHVNSTGSICYPVWVCKQHLADVGSCQMKFIRESDLEYAFTTMMNKLCFGWDVILESLFKALRGNPRKESLRRIDAIEQKLEENEGRRRTLTAIMAQGYLEPSVFTKESNDLTAEDAALTAEKDQLAKEVNGRFHEAEALGELIRYASHVAPSPDFDGELVERFLGHAVISTRNEVVFRLKCGLSLTERLGEQ